MDVASWVLVGFLGAGGFFCGDIASPAPERDPAPVAVPAIERVVAAVEDERPRGTIRSPEGGQGETGRP